ncbi:MAG: PEP-CTERM sorting domain-containing protein [Rhodocyclaceae bacterium]|nr:PEP-CTERM sorting domain-containing protein [Rhodocyclaceae bacterium]
MKKILFVASLALASATAQASSASYSDFLSWADEVAGIVTTDTFNSYSFGESSSLGTSVTLGANSFSIDGGQLYGNGKALSYDAPYHSSNYLEWQNNNPNTLTITLGDYTQAFGVNYGQFYGVAGSYSVVLGNGDSFTVDGNTGYSFFGVISTAAFKTIKITASDFPTIDNLSVGPVAAVPEPGTYALMLSGLGLMGLVGRRRSRR